MIPALLLVSLVIVSLCVAALAYIRFAPPMAMDDFVRKATYASTKNRWQRWVAMCLSLWAVFLFVGIPTASAHSHLGVASSLEPHVGWLFLGGAIFLVLAWVGGKTVGTGTLLSARARGIFGIIGTLLIVLTFVGFISSVTTPTQGCVDDPATAIDECGPDGFEFTITWSIGTTAGSTVPGAPYDVCDTEAGGTTGEWATTEARLDVTSVPVRVDALIAIDTDLATSAALWSEPNCLEVDHDLHLNTPVDQNGDGVADSITAYAGIDSISRTTLVSDGSNGTINAQVFVRDGVDETGDWYLLWKTDAGLWIPACSEHRGASTMGSSCKDVAVATHPGNAADDDVDLYVILEDRGPFGYQEPAVGGTLSISYHIAGKAGLLTIVLNSRATTNLT